MRLFLAFEQCFNGYNSAHISGYDQTLPLTLTTVYNGITMCDVWCECFCLQSCFDVALVVFHIGDTISDAMWLLQPLLSHSVAITRVAFVAITTNLANSSNRLIIIM